MRQEREAFDSALVGGGAVAHHPAPEQERAPLQWQQMFPQGVVIETVVTSLGDHPNAAAIGIRRVGEHLMLRLFSPSNTFDTLRVGTRFGVNIVTADQLDLVARAALKGHGDSTPELFDDELEWSEGIPMLFDVAARLHARVVERGEITGSDDFGPFRKAKVRAQVEAAEGDVVVPLRRPGPPLLEALVAASRLQVAPKALRGQLQEAIEAGLRASAALQKDPHPIHYKEGHPDGWMTHLLLAEALGRAEHAWERDP